MPKLRVVKIDIHDARQDIVRVPARSRIGFSDNQIVGLSVKGAKKLVRLLGSTNRDKATIAMDWATRKHFGLKLNQEADFTIFQPLFFPEYRWLINHSDITIRTANRLGIISLGLGILSFFLGIIALYPLL